MTASERAAQELKETLMRKWFDMGLGFRLIKDTNDTGAGICSIKLDNKQADDEVIESHGIKVFLDPISAAQLNDYELDYLDGPGQGFILHKTTYQQSEPQIFGKEDRVSVRSDQGGEE